MIDTVHCLVTVGTVVASFFQMDWFPSRFRLLKRLLHLEFWVIEVQEMENNLLHVRLCICLSYSYRV